MHDNKNNSGVKDYGDEKNVTNESWQGNNIKDGTGGRKSLTPPLKRSGRNARIIAKNLGFPVIGLAVFFAVWAIASAVYNKPFTLPSPWSALKSAGRLLGSADFWLRFGMSLVRTLEAFAVSFALALVLALSGKLCGVKKIIAPVMSIIRAVPTMAVIIMFLIWTNASVTPVLVAILVILPTLYSSFLTGLDKIPRELSETAKVFGVSRFQTVKWIYLPQLGPNLIENAASGISLTLKLVVSAEVMAVTKNSIGQLMEQSRSVRSDTAGVMAVTLLVCCFCIAAEYLIRLPLAKE